MALLAGAASVVTVAALIVIKTYAFIQSGSASVLASLIDSCVDAAVSLATLFAIRLSLKPPDESHRSGHGKVEGLAALFQAAFIGGAGVFLLFETIHRFGSVHEIAAHGTAIVIMAVSVALSLLLVIVQKRSLKYAPSLAVEADHAHYATDIVVNLGALVVLFSLRAGAPLWIDPLFAVCVALYLAITVRSIAMQGLDMLLDRELPDTMREAIARIVMAHSGVLGMHDLRTGKSGMRVFMSFDIEADPDLPLHRAHAVARDVEHELLRDFPDADILIHVDPHGDPHDTRHRVAGVHH